jgi:hypothetical protein
MAKNPKSYSVSVEGLSKLTRIPGGLDKAQREFLGEAVDELAEEVGKAAPGGRGGRVGRTWRGRTISSTRGVVESSHPGAKALDRGAYITPKKGKVLRFTVGGQERFARFVRLPATNYTKRGLRKRGTIIRKAYEKKFNELDIN